MTEKKIGRWVLFLIFLCASPVMIYLGTTKLHVITCKDCAPFFNASTPPGVCTSINVTNITYAADCYDGTANAIILFVFGVLYFIVSSCMLCSLCLTK